MFKGYEYSYDNGLIKTPFIYPRIETVRRTLAKAHGAGLDHTSDMVQQVVAAYVAFNPNNILIQKWDEGNDFVTVPMEAEYPWLRYYLGDPAAPTPPADDPSARQAEVDAEIAAFQRRVWKSQRSHTVQRITADVGGKVFDGDETSQSRMARALAIAHAEMLDQMTNFLGAQIGNPDLTVQDLVMGMHTTLTQTKQALSTTWVLADNTVTTVTADDLKAACHASMLQMESNWVPEETGS